MTSFAKMALVDAEELNRLRDKKITQYNPTVRTLATLDSEMENILRETKLDPEEKLSRYNATLLNFKNMYTNNTRTVPPNAIAAPPAIAPPAPDPIAPVAAPGPSDIAPFDLETALSVRDKGSLASALDHIEFYPDVISHAPSGEAVINRNLIPGSNYADLLRSLNSGSKKLNRTGQMELVSALAQIKFPHTKAKNPKMAGLIKREYAVAGLDDGTTRAGTAAALKRELKPQLGTGRSRKRIRFVTHNKSKKGPPGLRNVAKVYRLYR